MLAECSNDCSQVVPLDAVQRLSHGIKISMCVDAQGNIEVRVSGDPLHDVRWCLECVLASQRNPRPPPAGRPRPKPAVLLRKLLRMLLLKERKGQPGHRLSGACDVHRFVPGLVV